MHCFTIIEIIDYFYTITVAAIKAFPKYLTNELVCSNSAVPLINCSRDRSNFDFIDYIDQSECSRIGYSTLIGQLTGSCEHFKELLQKFEELIRGTAELEQMNWSNIFGTLLLPQL